VARIFFKPARCGPHIFQACPVWINTQSNITQASEHVNLCFLNLFASFFIVLSIRYMLVMLVILLSFKFTYVQILCGIRTTASVFWEFCIQERDYLHKVPSFSYCNNTVCENYAVLHVTYMYI
jgi:hypothetical protein